MSNLETSCHFKVDFLKVDEHTGGKWSIHGTKQRKDSQLQSLAPPAEYHSRESELDSGVRR